MFGSLCDDYNKQGKAKEIQLSKTKQQITFQKICIGFCLNFWRKSSGVCRHKVSLFLVNQGLKDNINKLSLTEQRRLWWTVCCESVQKRFLCNVLQKEIGIKETLVKVWEHQQQLLAQHLFQSCFCKLHINQEAHKPCQQIYIDQAKTESEYCIHV